MPSRIYMTLSNNQTYKNQPISTQKNTAPAPKSVNVGFKGSMIGRIHTIKPGCGSCGR